MRPTVYNIEEVLNRYRCGIPACAESGIISSLDPGLRRGDAMFSMSMN
jgi:hypothetical protein